MLFVKDYMLDILDVPCQIKVYQQTKNLFSIPKKITILINIIIMYYLQLIT